MKLNFSPIAIITILLTKCTTVTVLSYPQNSGLSAEFEPKEKIVKIQTKGTCGNSLILNEALDLEKKNNGDTIRFVNIIEQRRQEKFLIIPVSTEVCYTYDVIFYAK
jgi:hypothetical protein